ncbi:MAG: RNA polymerase-binding protein DksA [Deltaproteobacteria bacterium]|nr:MAG: RNA polymerase-binding protein DksA [Deltaproteobacteria bacterium]PIE72248.1 MAG: RNA polymerase-binding protein DksA [Deltaproteobacteria bacterium]
MNKKKLDFFRQQLEEKKQELLEEAGKTLDAMTAQTGNIPDPNDRATIESGRNFELRIREREGRLFAKINAALARIDDGSFGICEECEREIGLKRLEARPVTTLCIDCKTAQENKEKSQGL